MGFTYLDLYANNDKITATVSKESHIRSVGTANSRWSAGPFATFAIDGFSGIEFIDTGLLVDELLRRMTAQQLTEYLVYEFSFDELITMLRGKMR